MLLQKFSFTESQDVITLTHPVHGFLFDANNVYSILEYKGTAAENIRRLDDDEKVLLKREEYSPKSDPDLESGSKNRGGPQNKWFVTESGLYALILGSEKPQARAFKRWITHDVIPALRQTGTYTIPNGMPNFNPDTTPLERMAANLNISPMELAQKEMDVCLTIFSKFTNITGNHALLAANRLFRQTYQIDMLKTADVDLPSKVQARCWYPTELGRKFGLSGIKMNNLLEMAGLQTSSYHKGHKVWHATTEGEPYSEYVDVGKEHSNGTPIQGLKWYETVLDHDKVRQLITLVTAPKKPTTPPTPMSPTERLTQIQENPQKEDEDSLYQE